jgi:hypothetical protein
MRPGRAWAARGILVLALVLGSIGAAALASPWHAGAGHVHATAHQRATRLGHSTGTYRMNATQTIMLPWMY